MYYNFHLDIYIKYKFCDRSIDPLKLKRKQNSIENDDENLNCAECVLSTFVQFSEKSDLFILHSY